MGLRMTNCDESFTLQVILRVFRFFEKIPLWRVPNDSGSYSPLGNVKASSPYLSGDLERSSIPLKADA